MKRSAILLAASALALLPLATFSQSALGEATQKNVLQGEKAFGGWDASKPGVWRLIEPKDLPKPFATKSSSNAPGLIERPQGAMPVVGDGFKVELVKAGMEGPRVVRVAPNGDLFVADSVANTINVLRLGDNSAKPTQSTVFADGLNQPYGIAFYPVDNPQWVYVGNADSIVRFPYKEGDLKATGPAETIVSDIPSNHHWTRDIAFSPDGKTLYLAVGSGSNIAEDVSVLPDGGLDKWAADRPLGEMWGEEEGRAAVIAFDPDGKNRRVFATGIRNCSGLAIQPSTGDPWCVTNERDGLGDNVPSDYATHVEQGKFYGWPWYYIGGNEDPRAPLKGQRPDLADKVKVPDVLFQAHSAPLNIAFYGGDMFPAEYKGDAFVALHGSWNRGLRTGYKIVRLKFQDGKPTGEYQDFMTGFVKDADNVWGRPVGVAVVKDGSLIVTEDGGGTIWRVTYEKAPS
jgi:glucose/arabinose dehydrogenase